VKLLNRPLRRKKNKRRATAVEEQAFVAAPVRLQSLSVCSDFIPELFLNALVELEKQD
jgi:hypothetical protein